MLLRIDTFLCLADDTVECLVETFKNSHEGTTVVGDEFDPVADHCLQRMLLCWLLSTLHEYNY